MKRPLIATLFLVVCIVLGVVSLAYVEYSCSTLIKQVEFAEECLMTRNSNEAQTSFIELIDLFEKHKPALNLILGQGDTLEIRGDLNTAIYFLNCKDYPTALLHLQECKADLNRIIAGNEPTITTIF
jgi:hypothetical protein